MANQGYDLTQTGAQVQAALNKIINLDEATTEADGLMSASDKAKLDDLPSGSDLASSLSSKVDKETGKGLSTNDYTDEDKNAVRNALPLGVQLALDRTQDIDTIRSGAAAGATAYQKPPTGIPASDLASAVQTSLGKADTALQSQKQADWNEADSNDPAYIKNKPTIPAGVVVDQTYDATSENAQSGVAMAGALAGKQDTISDLSTIRTGAAAGATAVQPEAGKGLFSGSYNDLTDKPTIPDVTGKADKVSSPTSGNFAGLDSNGNLTDSGKKASDFQPTIDNNHKLDYGLLSNTPTIPDAQIQSDWNQSDNTKKDYIKNKPSIPAAQVNSDWNANSGVAQILNKPSIPDAVEANPTVPSGTTPTDLQNLKVGSNYYGIPQPTVDNTPTKNSANLVKSGGVYDAINPAVQSSQPAGGMLPNVMYNLGTLTGNVTIAFASPTDNAIRNEYMFGFTAGQTAPSLSWPQSIVDWCGNCLDSNNSKPEIEAGFYYEFSVQNGHGFAAKFV